MTETKADLKDKTFRVKVQSETQFNYIRCCSKLFAN